MFPIPYLKRLEVRFEIKPIEVAYFCFYFKRLSLTVRSSKLNYGLTPQLKEFNPPFLMTKVPKTFLLVN